MAPQTTPTPTSQSAGSTPAPSAASAKAFIPGLLMIFFGLCFTYTLSYVIYRIVKARRHQSASDIPDSPDRGVTRFMNGARLALNQRKPATPTPSEQPNTVDEEKLLPNPSHRANLEIPSTSATDSSSTPFSVLVPSFTLHPNQALELDTPPQGEDQGLYVSQGSASALAPTPASVPTQQPFSQRMAAKVKFLSRDRAEAIALDPKLAPVQGPLRPLSMVQSPPRSETRTLFGLGLKHVHSREHRDPETNSGAQ